MSKRVLAGLAIAGAIAATACRVRSDGSAAWRVQFGPVLGNELIVGRVATESQAWILTGGNDLVHIDYGGKRQTRSTLTPLGADEHVWGLASTGDGTFWTLIGRTVLGQFQADGRVLRRVPLPVPHVGLFAAGQELLYQVMDFQPPADALSAGPPGENERHPWGRMRTRSLALARASVAALNLVSCGATATASVPCWFPDQAVVTVTDSSGESRELALEGLPLVPPEVLLSSDNPRRPIRDAVIAADGRLWVLGSGAPLDSDSSSRPGGWLLNRYAADGRLESRVQLPEPARVVLGVRGSRCVLIAWNGQVVEVGS